MVEPAALHYEALHPTFGVAVRGLDPAADDDHPSWQEYRRAFREHRLLVVDLPGLTDDEHVRLLAQLGSVVLEGRAELRPVGYVSNVRPDGVLAGRAASWHVDFGFTDHPYEAISLYAVEIPPAGTVTRFVDAVAAAEALPARLRARVQGRTARHVVDVASPEGEAVVRVRAGRLDERYPHALRPVLWPHPVSGRDVLGVWEQQTDAVVELGAEESTALIEDLFAHLYQQRFVYEHQWAPGQLVVWDNRALQHSRPAVDAALGSRTLRRVCVGQQPDLSIFAAYPGRS